jgi:isocitrate dehydrogenase (NAD+)
MKRTDGLFLEVAREVAARYPDIEFEDRAVDNTAMQLVQRPEDLDVLLMPMQYGDILSDLAAGLIGGSGMIPGANIGTEAVLFEPGHGSAPKMAGMNRANPMATMLSGVMMLRHLGEGAAAERLEGAIASVIAEGTNVTYDLKDRRDDPSAVGTSVVADAVVATMSNDRQPVAS